MSETINSKYFVPDYAASALYYKQTGRVLDIGCGKGDASLWFAKRGFEVDALDILPESIKTLQTRADATGLAVNAYVADMADVNEERNYDIIVAVNSVYFLPPLGMRTLINRIKKITTPGGVNAISVWADENVEHLTRFPSTRSFLPSLYSDWPEKQPWRPANANGQVFYATTAIKPIN